MSTMVERVAKAIYEASSEAPDGVWEEAPEGWRVEYRGMAREAIEAMREPTDEMIKVGVQTHEGVTYSGIPSWQAMIDAALAETPV
jgi:hypothetical protein